MSARLQPVAAAVLLIAFAAQSVGGMRLLSATSDETTHLPSGYTYLVTGGIRLNPQHPPLIKLLCALPLTVMKPRLDLSNPAWTSEPPDEWHFGYDFLYSNDADRLLFWGRLPVVLLTVLLGLYVYRWTREMFGPNAGLVALFLYAFSPNVIAHSHLVTMDAGLTLFAFATLYHLWRWTRHGRAPDVIAAGVGLGLALATKFSGVIFVPVVVVLLGLAVLRRAGDGAPAPRRLLIGGALLLGLAAAVLWAVYLFPSDPLFYWDGLRRVNVDHNPDYAYYLTGDFEKGGWWYYFLIAFLVKTPVPTLFLFGLSIPLVARFRAGSWLDETFIFLPIVVFTTATSALADNLGIRYLLPVYPLIFLTAGRVVRLLQRGRVWVAAACVLGVWYLGSAVYIYPHHLSYFNWAVGGPARGHLYLDDSNIDWGEGLKQLKAHMDAEGLGRIRLLYGWNGSPDHYGIRYDPVSNDEWASRPTSGIYAVSTHLLVRGEYHARRLGVPTNWLTLYEPTGRVGYSFYVFDFDRPRRGG